MPVEGHADRADLPSRERDRPSVAKTAWWPRCTPSKNPTVTTEGRPAAASAPARARPPSAAEPSRSPIRAHRRGTVPRRARWSRWRGARLAAAGRACSRTAAGRSRPPRRRRDHGRVVRLRRERARGRDLRPGAGGGRLHASIARRRSGTREFVLPALQRGLVEVVPEYAGSALVVPRRGSTARPTSGPTPQLRARCATAGLDVLAAAAGAGPQRARGDRRARPTGLACDTISDLIRTRTSMTFGGPPECPDRPLCLPGLEDAYDLRLRLVPAARRRRAAHGRGDRAEARSTSACMFTTDGGARAAAPRRARGRPAPAARREPHPARAAGRARAVRPGAASTR